MLFSAFSRDVLYIDIDITACPLLFEWEMEIDWHLYYPENTNFLEGMLRKDTTVPHPTFFSKQIFFAQLWWHLATNNCWMLPNFFGSLGCSVQIQRWNADLVSQEHQGELPMQQQWNLMKKYHSWQFLVTFLGWLSDPFKWLSVLQCWGMKRSRLESPGSCCIVASLNRIHFRIIKLFKCDFEGFPLLLGLVPLMTPCWSLCNQTAVVSQNSFWIFWPQKIEGKFEEFIYFFEFLGL